MGLAEELEARLGLAAGVGDGVLALELEQEAEQRGGVEEEEVLVAAGVGEAVGLVRRTFSTRFEDSANWR